MKRKHKSSSKHSVAPGFPAMANPMDVADHPAQALPAPQGGAYDGAQQMMPGAPMPFGANLR